MFYIRIFLFSTGLAMNRLIIWDFQSVYGSLMVQLGADHMRKLVHFQIVPKSDRSFNWLGKIENSSIDKILNYTSLDWLT